MTYIFKWKRWLFWKSRRVVGHRYTHEQNKAVMYFEDGGVLEIKDWSKCVVRLGPDWALAQKKAMELEAGASVPTTF